MIGALQITPTLQWDACLELLRNKIGVGDFTTEVKDKPEKLLHYFENTWLSLGVIFCLFGYKGPRTTNHAESYHSKQRLHFSVNLKLGNWTTTFKQLAHTEELDAVNVYEGREPPRRQRSDYAEITKSFLEAKDRLLAFLSTDEGFFRGEGYEHKMSKYLSHVGRFMGISSFEFSEGLDEDQEEQNNQENLLNISLF